MQERRDSVVQDRRDSVVDSHIEQAGGPAQASDSPVQLMNAGSTQPRSRISITVATHGQAAVTVTGRRHGRLRPVSVGPRVSRGRVSDESGRVGALAPELHCDVTGTRDWPLPGPIQELAPDP
jgi:hypothetical protein